MRSRSVIIVSALLALLVLATAAAWAVDRSGRNEIASGVKVAGVDIGGLDRAAAERRLEQQLLRPLREPVHIDHGRDHWTLDPAKAGLSVDIPGSVDAALVRSRSGTLFARTMRAIGGGGLDVNVEPDIRFSRRVVAVTVARVAKEVDRPAMDASVAFGLDGPKLVPGRDGLSVDEPRLRRDLRAAIASTTDRRVSAHTRKTRPKVGAAQARKGYETALVVNRGAFTLSLYRDFKKVHTWPVAVGAVGLETPAGTYHIQNKAVDPAWTMPNSSWVPEDKRGTVVPGGTPQNPLKARWLGIFNGAGIHGIDPSEYGSIGHAASHGCVRMRIPDVIALYPQVPVGAPIYIG